MSLGWDIRLAGRLGSLSIDLHLSTGGAPVAIVGPNGAGKTTLLRAIAGARLPLRGHVHLDERVLMDSSSGVDLPPEQRGVGYLPQGYALFPHLTALENVAFGLSAPTSSERRARALSLLGELAAEHLADRLPRELSGGEQQRVALARALAVRPRGLLLDEPLAALDASSRRAMRGFLIEYLKASRRPALVVTHDLRDVLALGGDVVVLMEGHVAQRGSPETLAKEPANDFVAEFFQSPAEPVGR